MTGLDQHGRVIDEKVPRLVSEVLRVLPLALVIFDLDAEFLVEVYVQPGREVDPARELLFTFQGGIDLVLQRVDVHHQNRDFSARPGVPVFPLGIRVGDLDPWPRRPALEQLESGVKAGHPHGPVIVIRILVARAVLQPAPELIGVRGALFLAARVTDHGLDRHVPAGAVPQRVTLQQDLGQDQPPVLLVDEWPHEMDLPLSLFIRAARVPDLEAVHDPDVSADPDPVDLDLETVFLHVDGRHQEPDPDGDDLVAVVDGPILQGLREPVALRCLRQIRRPLIDVHRRFQGILGAVASELILGLKILQDEGLPVLESRCRTVQPEAGDGGPERGPDDLAVWCDGLAVPDPETPAVHLGLAREIVPTVGIDRPTMRALQPCRLGALQQIVALRPLQQLEMRLEGVPALGAGPIPAPTIPPVVEGQDALGGWGFMSALGNPPGIGHRERGGRLRRRHAVPTEGRRPRGGQIVGDAVPVHVLVHPVVVGQEHAWDRTARQFVDRGPREGHQRAALIPLVEDVVVLTARDQPLADLGAVDVEAIHPALREVRRRGL